MLLKLRFLQSLKSRSLSSLLWFDGIAFHDFSVFLLVFYVDPPSYPHLLLPVLRYGFLFSSRCFFTTAYLLLHKTQMRSSLEYCSHRWDWVSSISFSVTDRFQQKAMRLTNDPSLTFTLQPLAHLRVVASQSLFYRYLIFRSLLQ